MIILLKDQAEFLAGARDADIKEATSLAKSGGTISRSSSWSEGEETELEVALRSGESAILRRVKSGRREHLQLEIKALKV